MSALLRVDDFPGTKQDEFWKHNLDNFKRFDDLMERFNVVQYTLGVIPKYTTEKDIDWLASNPRIRVALHGVEHDERFNNEFRDFETENDVYNKLMSAKTPLERANGNGKIECYIPPHNCIDMRTARALVRAGFNELMCGPGTDMSIFAHMMNSHLFEHLTYSYHPHMYGRTDEMMDRDNAIPVILGASTSSNPVITLHWPWEWNIGLGSLERFLKKVGHVFGER